MTIVPVFELMRLDDVCLDGVICACGSRMWKALDSEGEAHFPLYQEAYDKAKELLAYTTACRGRVRSGGRIER